MSRATLCIQLDPKILEIWKQGEGLILRLNKTQECLLFLKRPCGEHSIPAFSLDLYMPVLSKWPAVPYLANSPPGLQQNLLKSKSCEIPTMGGGVKPCWRQSRRGWRKPTRAPKNPPGRSTSETIPVLINTDVIQKTVTSFRNKVDLLRERYT